MGDEADALSDIHETDDIDLLTAKEKREMRKYLRKERQQACRHARKNKQKIKSDQICFTSLEALRKIHPGLI